MKNKRVNSLQILSIYNANENMTYDFIYSIGINRVQDLDYIYTLYIIKHLYDTKTT